MLDPGNPRCESEHEAVTDPSALPNPLSTSDKLYVKGRISVTARLVVLGLALIVLALTLFRYPQSLNWKMWAAYIEPKLTTSNDAAKPRQSLASASRQKVTESGRKRTIVATQAKDFAEPSNLSSDDLALGFSKARWRMSINDAKLLWPLEETVTPVAPELDGPHVGPIHEEATLSLEHYAYAGCTFTVKFNFEDKKLSNIHMEADGSANFQSCHSEILAALTRQYGVTPLSSYRGYSLHASWSGPSTDVVYDEIQNAVIEIRFSSSG